MGTSTGSLLSVQLSTASGYNQRDVIRLFRVRELVLKLPLPQVAIVSAVGQRF
jgi:hypothetical protein